MRSLQVPLDAFGAEHAAVEGELFPGLEPDHLVVADFQLNAALLTAEATMRLHKAIGLDGGGQPRTGHGRAVWTKAGRNLQVIDRDRSHVESTARTPQRALRQAQQRTTASRANLLVMVNSIGAVHFIREAQLAL